MSLELQITKFSREMDTPTLIENKKDSNYTTLQRPVSRPNFLTVVMLSLYIVSEVDRYNVLLLENYSERSSHSFLLMS